MMTRVVGFIVGASILYGCGSAEGTSQEDSITGTYIREYSNEILNELSGNKVGMRTTRDTIYISAADNGYRVENSKWSMNDYDQDGWRNMEHGEFGPMAPFDAIYNEDIKTLSSKNSGVAPDLVIGEDGKLSVGKKSQIAYTKID